ncbi:MAG: dTDP-4-amino-4,6-dideoxygalactose transaminase [Pseudomonadales bacterium]
MNIPFNRPLITGREHAYLDAAVASGKLGGAGVYSRRCQDLLERTMPGSRCFVTTSASHALEVAALLCDLAPGDEVIVPSYAFPTTASAFVRCGARIVFVDVDPATMNVDPEAVQQALSDRTRVVVALHYGGVSCDMTALSRICEAQDLILVEDAAQAVGASYRDQPCGSLGRFGCFSFHESKNVHCGEGGAIVCNDLRFADRLEIVLEKGTDRSRFFRGEVDKYTWQDLGSSYVMSELTASFLLAQLEAADAVTLDRRRSWYEYADRLEPLAALGLIELAAPPDHCFHNGHLFWIKLADPATRDRLTDHLRQQGIHCVFHYQPLHSSPAGKRYGRFSGVDAVTTRDAGRLLRLPMYFEFRNSGAVVEAIESFFHL